MKSTLSESSDEEWEKWGKKDPYFGVLTNESFRKENLDAAALSEFFRQGESDINELIDIFKRRFGVDLSPKRSIDFGCGVGRVLIPLARISEETIGVDVSVSMLNEAHRNCQKKNISNVRLLKLSDYRENSSLSVDFIHSMIVFQHIPTTRGIVLFNTLLTNLRPGGLGAIHFLYSKSEYSNNNGIQKEVSIFRKTKRKVKRILRLIKFRSEIDPFMEMNCYNLNQIIHILQNDNIKEFYTKLTDHGGCWGVLLAFQKEASPNQA